MKILIAFLLSLSAIAGTDVLTFKVADESYVVEKVTDGHGTIWGMEFIAPQKIIFTEKSGQISTLDLSTGVVRQMKNVPAVYDSGQGGLLDIALHPEFSKNQWVYITYSKKVGSKQTTAMARARLDLQKESFDQWQDLFVGQPAFSTAHHYGSRMAFDKRGYLFVSMGERGQADLAQSLEANNGKVMRFHDDGRIPSDNPFVNVAKARKEIWSYGHRNPQGLFYDATTDTLYEQEHGPMGGDEINLIQPGKNYGWPVITYGREYSGGPVGRGITQQDGMEQPIKYFVPSIAPSSLMVYRNGALKFFNDKFLSAALALQHLNAVAVKDCFTACEDRFLEKLDERFRDVKQGPDGLIYLSTDNGRIYRIKLAAKK